MIYSYDANLAFEIFEAALEIPLASIPSLLQERCGETGALRNAVEQLLDADLMLGRKNPFASRADGLCYPSVDPWIGQRVGEYAIRRLIAEGGMGRVFEATREDDYRDQVAIKIVKRDVTSPDELKSFYRERQIHATIHHPYVAKVFDGGTAFDGLPYIVMEYIEGESLTTYCNGKHLHIVERLSLFLRVCEGVSAIHQQTILHRDLTPSNILVTKDGTPKIVDFGIAKHLNPEIGNQSSSPTLPMSQRLTKIYASPEHVLGKHMSQSSDVYSLGIVLYELLTNIQPRILRMMPWAPVHVSSDRMFSRPEVPSKAVQKQSLHVEWEPDVHGTSARPARYSKKELSHNSRLLRGDLDTIIMKAIEVEAGQRYGTVDQLSAEIDRYLHDEPILARRQSYAYRTKKFLIRYRKLVSACLVGTGFLLCMLGVVLHQRNVARNFGFAAEQAKTAALRLATIAHAQRLAVESRLSLASHPQRAILLASEAIRLTESLGRDLSMIETALREGMEVCSGVAIPGYVQNVSILKFFPDGNQILTGGFDRRLDIWDLLVTELKSPRISIETGFEVTTAAISPDGRQIVAGGWSSEMRLWDIADSSAASVPRSLRGNNNYIRAVNFAPNGRWIVSGCRDGTAMIWISNGSQTSYDARVVTTLPDAWITDVLVTENNRWAIVATSREVFIRRLDVDGTPETYQHLIQNATSLTDGIFKVSRNGEWLFVAQSLAEGQLWHLGDGTRDVVKVALTDDADDATCAAFSAESQHLLIGTRAGRTHAYELSCADRVATRIRTTDHTAAISAVAFATQGQGCAAVSKGREICVWPNLEQDTVPRRTPLVGSANEYRRLLFSNDGCLLFAGIPGASILRVALCEHDSDSDTSLLCGAEGAITNLTQSPAGKWMACLSEDQIPRIWSTTLFADSVGSGIAPPAVRNVASRRVISFAQSPIVLDVNASGSVFSRDSSSDGTFARGSKLTDVSPYADITAACTSGAFHVGVRDENTESFMLYTLSGLSRDRLDGPLMPMVDGVTTLAFSQSGRWLALARRNGEIELLDIAARRYTRPAHILSGVMARLRWVRFSADEQIVFAETVEGLIQCWNLLNAERIQSVSTTHQGGWLVSDHSITADSLIVLNPGPQSIIARRLSRKLDLLEKTDLRCDRVTKAVLATSEDGQYAVVEDVVNRLHVWEISKGKRNRCVVEFSAGGDPIGRAIFARLRNELVAIDAQGAVHLWKWGEREDDIVHNRLPFVARAECVAFSNDENHLIVGYGNGFLRRWPLETKELLRRAELVTGRKLSTEERTNYANSEPSPIARKY